MKSQYRNQHESLKDEELISHIKKSIYLLDRIQELPTLIQIESMHQLREPALRFIETLQQIQQTYMSPKLEPCKMEMKAERNDSFRQHYQLLESVSSGLK